MKDMNTVAHLTIHLLLLGVIAAPSSSIRWTKRGSMPQPRSGYAMGVLGARMVVAGGSYWTGNTKQRTAQVDAFDPACECWRSLAPLPTVLSDPAAVTVGNTFYVLGGTDGNQVSQDVYAFDGSTWVKREDLRMPEPRIYGVAVTDGHRIYVLSGISDSNNYSSGLPTVWSIDPAHASEGWKKLPDCGCETRVTAGAAILSNSLYLIGGMRAKQGATENLDDIWVLDLKKQEWKLAGKLPEARRAMWAAADGDKILVFGGYTDKFLSDVLAIRKGTITSFGEVAEPVAAVSFVRIGKQWYTAGGEIGVHVRGANTWSGNPAQ